MPIIELFSAYLLLLVSYTHAQQITPTVLSAEFTALRDDFGHQRLREGKYTPGQIDQQWSDEIKKDFLQWVNSQKNLPMSRKELDDYMKERNWSPSRFENDFYLLTHNATNSYIQLL